MFPDKVDVHAHFIPEEYREALIAAASVSKQSLRDTARGAGHVSFSQVAVSQMSVSVAMSQKAFSTKDLTPDLFKAL
jgi:hypothetical protein